MPESAPLRLLWVKSGPLHPLNTGGRRRTHAMLRELNRQHRVTWLAGLPEGTALDPAEPDDPYAAEKIWIPTRESRKGSPRFAAELAANQLFSRLPYVLSRYRSAAVRDRLIALDRSGAFDLIVCDFLTPAVHFTGWERRTPAVLFQHNIEAQIWQRLAQEKTQPLVRAYFQGQYRRMWRAERDLSAAFDGVITVSPEDHDLALREYGLKNLLGAVPTGVDTDFFQPPAAPRDPAGPIAFLGSMDWMPNVECVQFFAHDILPAIRRRYPDCRFRIIGRNPTPAVRRLAVDLPGIEITGTVDDVRPHLDAASLLVVPLRSGGGTRIKIFEAMAQGVPVVSTTIGAEGLPVTDGRDILIADQPDTFADAVIRLLDQPDFAATLARQAREKLVASHSWSRVAATFIDLCAPVIRRS
ncbi:MAG: glycosyltransferase [Verrucomicrobiales bacterium]|nr:glycosyltransferase [Verrucomicrobiales bacterium]